MLWSCARHAWAYGTAVAVCAAGVLTTSPSTWAQPSWLGPVRVLPSPATSDSAQPQLHSSSRGTLLSWVERQGSRASLKFSSLERRRWSAARSVASGDNWFVNWADVPSVVRLDDGTLAAHWLQKSGAGTYAYDVRVTHSSDGGRTWAPSSTPHHDGTQTEHGFASLFQMPGSGLGIVWLDGRQTPNGGAGHQAAHAAPAGAMTIRFGLYDRAWMQVVDRPIDERVCDCCPTTAAVTSEGPIVAFRNRTDDEVRDIYVSRMEAMGWTEPVAVHADGWKIAACPVNGPMLSARGRQVVLAWFTAVGDVGHVYVAFSRDAGRTFGKPLRLDDVASQGRVDVELLPDGSAAASWIELADGRATLMVRRLSPEGTRSAAVAVATLEGSRTSGYPRIAGAEDALMFAWTDTAGSTAGWTYVTEALMAFAAEPFGTTIFAGAPARTAERSAS